MSELPVIKEDRGIQTLYVKGEPFFVLGGEIHNSSASNLTYMKEQLWTALQQLNLNTVIAPVYWETVEAVEGVYEFELVDFLIGQARENRMHLILLWFGLWKNSESLYVPEWMKQDSARFFRSRKITGEPINTISPFCQAAITKDAVAFQMLMQHLKEKDEKENTVILMQVENEIGLLGTERDYCELADTLFAQVIPEELQTIEKTKGNWKEVFGINAEEYFMAYYFAKAVETITSTGQAVYPLPCYTNAWLKQFPWYPGSYPSGGPVREVHSIWKKIAPSLCTLAPDIYVPYVDAVMNEYCYPGNPLLIPEVRKDAVTASYCLYAMCNYHALGYSPFGIEELALDPSQIEKLPMEVMLALNIDPSAFDTVGSKEYLGAVYEFFNEIKPLYLKYRGTQQLQCYLKKSETDAGTFLRFREYDLEIRYMPQMQSKPIAAGMILELDSDTFLLSGMMSIINIRPKPGEAVKVEYIRLEEGTISNGEWIAGRILNGDEKLHLKFDDKLISYKLTLYKYS